MAMKVTGTGLLHVSGAAVQSLGCAVTVRPARLMTPRTWRSPGPPCPLAGRMTACALMLPSLTEGHGDLRADLQDRDSPHAGPHIDSAAGQRLPQLLGRASCGPRAGSSSLRSRSGSNASGH